MLRSGIAGSYGSSIFSFLSNFCAVCRSGCINFTLPPTVYECSLFSTSLPAFVICGLFMMAILTGVKWYCIAIFICVYLMIPDIEHLFTYLLTIYVFFEINVQVFCSFSHQGFFFGYWVVWAFYIFWMLTPYQSFANIFSHLVDCIFVLLMISLAVPKLLSLIRCHLSPFCKFCFQLIVILQKLKKLKVLVLLEFLIKTLTNIEQSAPWI